MKIRDIKFRAYDTFTKKMIFEGFNVIGEITAFGGIDLYVQEHPDGNRSTLDRILNDVVLQQYTGLTDRNGVEIYEGDLLNAGADSLTLEVIFDNGAFCFKNDQQSGSDRLHQMRTSKLEIIGNIFLAENEVK